MKPLLFVLALAGFLFAASDTLYDTVYVSLDWHAQPSALALDWKTGNLTATLSNPIMQALPYDSTHGILFNAGGANNIWYDSTQRADSLKFPQKNVCCADLRDSLWQHCKKYFKKQVKTAQKQ